MIDAKRKGFNTFTLSSFELLKKQFIIPKTYLIQCPLDIATLDKAAALPIATSTPVTDLRHYINSNLVYNDLKI